MSFFRPCCSSAVTSPGCVARGACFVCTETAEELIRALAYPKFKLSPQDREELLGDYLPFAERVEVARGIGQPKCKDPDDQKFLDLAHAGRAAMLISGDKALLALAGTCPFDIVSPAQASKVIG